MQVRIETNAKKVEKALKQKGKDVNQSLKRALSITAQEGINIIEDRTDKGVGYKGGAFAPYTEKYAIFRSNRGRGKNVDLLRDVNLQQATDLVLKGMPKK